MIAQSIAPDVATNLLNYANEVEVMKTRYGIQYNNQPAVKYSTHISIENTRSNRGELVPAEVEMGYSKLKSYPTQSAALIGTAGMTC
jgi:hypothetical protein